MCYSHSIAIICLEALNRRKFPHFPPKSSSVACGKASSIRPASREPCSRASRPRFWNSVSKKLPPTSWTGVTNGAPKVRITVAKGEMPPPLGQRGSRDEEDSSRPPSKMSFGKRAPRARFEITLEAGGQGGISKRHSDPDLPGSMARGRGNRAAIVAVQPRGHLSREARVKRLGLAQRLKEVDVQESRSR